MFWETFEKLDLDAGDATWLHQSCCCDHCVNHLGIDLCDCGIRIRGKDEIIPFKDKKEIQSVKAHLCSIFSGFVKIGDWYLKMSEVKEYKPVTAEDMNPYILFKTSKFGNIKVRFPKDEDMNAELLVLDQLFDVE